MICKMLFAAVLVLVIIASGCVAPGGTGASDKEQKCTSSGGQVTNASCCTSSADFPDSCLMGACGCSPSDSHQIRTCDCGEGKCFDGDSCVAMD